MALNQEYKGHLITYDDLPAHDAESLSLAAKELQEKPKPKIRRVS